MKQTISDYASASSEALKKNSKSALVLLAITVLPVQAILIIVNEMVGTPVSDSGFGFILSGVGIMNLLLFVAWIIFHAGFLSLLSKDVKADDYKKALKNGNKRFWPLLGATLLLGVIIAAGLFLLVLPGIYLGVALMYTSIAVVLEKLGIGAAMGRSFELVRKRWWKTFGKLLPIVGLFFIWGLVMPNIPEMAYFSSTVNYLVGDLLQVFAIVWVYQMYLDAKTSVMK